MEAEEEGGTKGQGDAGEINSNIGFIRPIFKSDKMVMEVVSVQIIPLQNICFCFSPHKETTEHKYTPYTFIKKHIYETNSEIFPC